MTPEVGFTDSPRADCFDGLVCHPHTLSAVVTQMVTAQKIPLLLPTLSPLLAILSPHNSLSMCHVHG